jgi:hypothetical protein
MGDSRKFCVSALFAFQNGVESNKGVCSTVVCWFTFCPMYWNSDSIFSMSMSDDFV